MIDVIKRIFTCSMKTLLYEADLILTAAEKQTAFVTKRLGTLVTDSRTLWKNLGGEGSDAGEDTSAISQLTQQQNDAIVTMLDKLGAAKESARKAFKGQKTKLSAEFTLGENEPRDLASILGRAQKVSDACGGVENAGALQAKGGWIADDTAELDAAIGTVSTIDKQQLASMSVKLTSTNDRNKAANTLYENLQTIQNAAAIEWPERNPENRGTLSNFRFSHFPPPKKQTAAKKAAASKAMPASTPAPTPAKV